MNVFSESELLEIQAKANLMWRDARVNLPYKAEVAALTAIRSNQTAQLAPLQDAKAHKTVALKWITTSNLTVVDGKSNCVIDGPELGSASKTYELDMKRAISFSINEDDLNNNMFSKQEVIAQGLLGAIKLLDEDVASKSLAKADGYIGTNAFTGGRTVTNGKVQIAANLTPQERYAYFAKARILNRMSDAYLIDNGNTFESYQIAQYNAGNDTGSGVVTAFGDMRMYFDMFNFAAAGLTTDALMIQRGALAFASRARFSTTPEYLGGEIQQTRYSVESNALPGIFYDVYYTMKCITNEDDATEENTVHTWLIQARFGLFANPSLNAQTGVLGFDIA